MQYFWYIRKFCNLPCFKFWETKKHETGCLLQGLSDVTLHNNNVTLNTSAVTLNNDGITPHNYDVKGPFKKYVTLFCLFPTPMWYLVTLSRTSCDVTVFIFQKNISSQCKTEDFCSKKSKKGVTWIFGWPPPFISVCHLVTLSRNPPPWSVTYYLAY